MLKVEHGLRGEGSGFTENLTLIIGLMWSLFQLASAGFILIDAIFVRAIHLTFAISLVYLNIPMLKQGKTGDWDKRILLAMNRVTVIDYIFAIFAAFSALYIILDYTGIASRAGLPITRDLIFGFLLIILLLEATRRVIGTLFRLSPQFLSCMFFQVRICLISWLSKEQTFPVSFRK